MLQIQNIETGWNKSSAENLRFDFMVETMKDIHLMQEIIRNYITSYFYIRSKFGYEEKDGVIVLGPEFKYPYDKPIRVIIERDGNNLSYHMKVRKKVRLQIEDGVVMNIADVWFERKEVAENIE